MSRAPMISTVASGSGSVNIAVPDETGETWGETYLSMGGDYGSDGTLYQNYIFPEGGTIHCDEGISGHADAQQDDPVGKLL